MRYLQPVSHLPLPSLSLCPPAPVCILRPASSSHRRSLRPSRDCLSADNCHPGCLSLRHHHTPLPSLVLIQTPLSFLDRDRPRADNTPSVPTSTLEARLALPNPRRITAARGRVIRSSTCEPTINANHLQSPT